MAEINTAYAALTRGSGPVARSASRPGAQDANGDVADAGAHDQRRPWTAGPPPPPVTRPVTGRLDTSHTFQPRNQTITPPGTRIPLTGQPPKAIDRSRPELRASRPSGPMERDWARDHVRRELPTLDEALVTGVEFGKFHGHTLGEIAAFEPSYIDWLATTMTRDPDVAAAARVISGELDRRGIRRPHRPERPGWQSNPFR